MATRDAGAAFQRIFRASRTPMGLADATTLRFVDANDAYCEMVGYSKEELLSMTPLDITVAEDGAREAELFQAVVASERYAYSLEKRFVHKRGRLVWCSVSVTVLLGEDGAPDLGVAICEDITERKTAEEERRRFDAEMLQAQKLESLGLLAGGIAHDFNNLLVGVMGNAELARRRVDDEETREILDDLLESAQVASEMCRQMLAYSGGGAVERRPVDLSDLVSSSLRLFDASKRGRVQLERSPSPAVTVSDVVQLRQLVLNLLTNAYEATDDDGAIRVRLWHAGRDALEGAQVVVEPDGAGPWIWLEVSDDGVGMDAATLARAFEPFRSTKGQGRGLGLAAVSGIVRGHGAALAARTSPGEGTAFLVGLPRASASIPPEPAQPDAPEPAARGTRVLLCDDDPMVRRVMSRTLAMESHEVIEVGSLSAGLAQLESGDALDVVVTDLTMPDGSGMQLASRARERGIPVVVVTGYSEATTKHDPGDRVSAILRKPFRPAELLAAVGRALRG